MVSSAYRLSLLKGAYVRAKLCIYLQNQINGNIDNIGGFLGINGAAGRN